MEKLVVRDYAELFANGEIGGLVDMIANMKLTSPDFVGFIEMIGGEVAQFNYETRREKHDELAGFLSTVNYFLKGVSEVCCGLPEIHGRSFDMHLKCMGPLEYQLEQLLRFFDVKKSIGFVAQLIDRLRELQTYTQRCSMLIMRIVMNEIVKQNYTSR